MSTLISDRSHQLQSASPRRLEIRAADAGLIGLAARLLTVVALTVAVALIVMIATASSPIADDYGDLASIGHTGVLQYLHSYWSTLTDRYAGALLMVALIKPLGVNAVHILTPLLLILLFGFSTAAAHTLAAPGRSARQIVIAAAAAAVVLATATPSLFDTLGWFNAVAIYFAGVTAAAGAAAWMARLALRTKPAGPIRILLSAAIGLAAAGFIELIGMVIVLAGLLAAATARAQLAPSAKRRRPIVAYLGVALGSAGGTFVVLYGPGSRARYRFQHGGFDRTRIVDALHANLSWLTTFRWDALGALAVGLLVFNLRPARIAPKTARWLFTWCLFLVCVPMLVVDVSTAYAGQIVAAPRTAYIATVFVAAGVALFAYLLVAAMVSEHHRLKAAVTPVAALALIAATGGFGAAAIPVVRAEHLREQAVALRAASIRRQLTQHRQWLELTPAPLAIEDTSAFDLTFHHRGQYIYVLEGLRQYYGIPAETKLDIDPTQPGGYCLNDVTVPWAGIESCEQLSQTSRS